MSNPSQYVATHNLLDEYNKIKIHELNHSNFLFKALKYFGAPLETLAKVRLHLWPFKKI